MVFIYIFIFILGLAVGSFLNVVIFRLENGEKIINDRSKCLKCKHILAWCDLVPVLSFVFLKGKCGYCREKISWQYPIVELATGIIFVLIFNYLLRINELTNYGLVNNFQFSTSNFQLISQFPNFPISQFLVSLVYYLFIASALIVIFVYDLKHYIIPDKVVYLAIAISSAFNIFSDMAKSNFQFSIFNFQSISNFQFLIFNLYNSQFINYLFAAFAAAGFFLTIVLLTSGKGMGGGDVKLGFLMGMVLGWPNILLAVFSSFIFGSIIGLYLIAIGKKKMKSIIPFGPFLVLGTLIVMFWGEKIMRWYFDQFLFL